MQYILGCTPRFPLDIVFALDTARVGATHSKTILQFIVNVSSNINMASGDVTVATVSNGCAGESFTGEPGTNPASVKADLASYETPRFDHLMRSMRIKAVDGRRETKHVGVIFITDRLSPVEYDKARREMMRARYQKTAIFGVGIGDLVDETQTRALTALGGYYMHAFNYKTLPELSAQLLYHMCMFGVDK